MWENSLRIHLKSYRMYKCATLKNKNTGGHSPVAKATPVYGTAEFKNV